MKYLIFSTSQLISEDVWPNPRKKKSRPDLERLHRGLSLPLRLPSETGGESTGARFESDFFCELIMII